MSSSVFKDYPSSNPDFECTDENLRIDSNLVIVVNKDGQVSSVDQKTLHSLLAHETQNTSVSYIRVTSPTPSLQEEIEEEERQEKEERKSRNTRGIETDSLNNLVREESEDPPHVYVTVEGFYPADQAKSFANKVLSLAGIENPLSIETLDYNFQRYVIRNDHCYTPHVSPTEKLTKRLTNEKSITTKVDPEKSSVNKTKATRKTRESNTSESSETENTTSQLQNILEDSSETESSDISSEEADHDSDLDYNIHSRNKKAIRKTGKRGNRPIVRSSRDNHNTSSANTNNSKNQSSKRRHFASASLSEDIESVDGGNSSSNQSKPNNDSNIKKRPGRIPLKKPILTSTPVRSIPKIGNKTMPPIVKTNERVHDIINKAIKREENTPSTSTVTPVSTPTTTTAQPILLINQIVNNNQICIKKEKKQPAHVEALYSDMSSLFSTPDIIKKNPATNAHIVITQTLPTHKMIKPQITSAAPSSNTTIISSMSAVSTASILPTIPTTINNSFGQQQQQGQHKTFVEEENDKQLDLIDSIVQKQLEEEKQQIQNVQHAEEDEKNKHIIPNIVKMLETSTEFQQQIHNPATQHQQSNANVTASLMDDILPEDLLQHVAELAENKELQAVLDKQVLGVSNLNSIIPNMSTSIVQTTLSQTQTVPLTIISSLSPAARKDPIKIIRSDGRVITLPPIEAPATRGAKRRAQNGNTIDDNKKTNNITQAKSTQEEKIIINPAAPVGKIFVEEGSKVLNRRNSVQQKVVPITLNNAPTILKNMTPTITEVIPTAASVNKGMNSTLKTTRRQISTNSTNLAVLQEPDDIDSDESWNSEDDPDRLWCICKQPHNNRFMICCDLCEDWYHGKCVNITKAMGQQMEDTGIEWTCPNCIKKKHEEKYGKSLHQTKLTDFLMDGTHNYDNEIVANIISTKIAKESNAQATSITNCIVCRKQARNSSIYCSDDCIRQHASKTTASTSTVAPIITMSANLPVVRDNTNKLEKVSEKNHKVLKYKNERVVVYEKSTGRCFAGNMAPTVSNLKQWLEEHPTYDVVEQGTAPALALQARQKQQLQQQQLQSQQPKQIQIKQQQQVKPLPTKEMPNAVRKQQTTSGEQLFSQPVKIQTQVKGQNHGPPAGETKKLNLVSVQQQQTLPTITKYKQTTIAQKSTGQQLTLTSAAAVKQQSGTAVSSSNKTSNKSTTLQNAKSTSKTPEEPIRQSIRRTLKEQLSLRMSESGSVKMTEDEIQKFATETEKEMFLLFNRDTGAKYKAKYRSLSFNIKDRKNLTLFQKICDKSIEPKQLVRLTPDQLASQELAQWRENENKHQLEMIKKSELDLLACAKNYVLKTHKGEEVIESKESDRLQLDSSSISVEDVVTVLNSSTVSNTSDSTILGGIGGDEQEGQSSTPTMRYDKGKDFESSIYVKAYTNASSTAEGKSTADRKTRKDSSTKSRSRSRDRHKSSSSTSKHKRKKSHERSRDHREDRHHKDRKKNHSRSRSRSRGEKDNSKKSSKKHEQDRRSSKDGKDRERRSKDKDRVSKSKITSTKSDGSDGVAVVDIVNTTNTSNLSENSENLSIVTESKTEAVQMSTTEEIKMKPLVEGPPLVSEMKSSPEQDPENVPINIMKPTTVDRTVENSEDNNVLALDNDLTLKESKSLWTGVLAMSEISEFVISAHTISGDDDCLAKELPSRFDIVGRIIPNMVWDYISKIKKTPNKEIVIIRMDSKQTSHYSTLYAYLDSRDRLGVVDTKSAYIKDFYIIPLANAKDIPSVLIPANDKNFLTELERPNILLGVIVKIKAVKKTVISSSSSKVSSRQANRSVNINATTNPSKSAAQSNKLNDRYTQQTLPLNNSKLKSSSSSDVSGISGRSKLTQGLPSTKELQPVDDNIIKFYKNQNTLDDDEPYSPGGSDEGDAEISLNVSAPADSEEIRKKMEEINRQIEAQKKEIAGILTNANEILVPDEPYSPSRSPIMQQNFNTTNIALPSNLSEILARFNKNPLATELGHAGMNLLANDIKSLISDDVEEYVPTPTGVSNYKSSVEYHPASSGVSYKNILKTNIPITAPPPPNITLPNHDIDERILMPQLIPGLGGPHTTAPPPPQIHSTPSKLASLSDAELLSLIPNECLQEEVTAAAAAAAVSSPTIQTSKTSNSTNAEPTDADVVDDVKETLPPPIKKSKWDQKEKQPTLHGLEKEPFESTNS